MPDVNYSIFKRTLARGSTYPLYVLYGDEPFFLFEGVELLKKRLLPEGEASTVSYFDAKEAELAEILDELRTQSFFVLTRMVVVENAVRLWDKPGVRKALDSYLANSPPRAYLVLKCPVTKYKKEKPQEEEPSAKKEQHQQTKGRVTFSDKIKESALLVRCRKVYDNQLVRWATAQMKDLGYRLPAEASRMLVAYIGSDLFRLHSELEKLASYAGNRRTITVRDVSTLVGADPSASIFSLSEALANKNLEEALLSLQQISRHGSLDPAAIIALITKLYLRKLWKVSQRQSAGLSHNEIAAALRMKDFPLSNIEQQLRHFTPGELKANLSKLVETDFAIKTSRLPRTAALQLLLIELCR